MRENNANVFLFCISRSVKEIKLIFKRLIYVKKIFLHKQNLQLHNGAPTVWYVHIMEKIRTRDKWRFLVFCHCINTAFDPWKISSLVSQALSYHVFFIAILFYIKVRNNFSATSTESIKWDTVLQNIFQVLQIVFVNFVKDISPENISTSKTNFILLSLCLTF
jgi:hypothetical protein